MALADIGISCMQKTLISLKEFPIPETTNNLIRFPSNPTKGPTKAGSGGKASQNKTSGGTNNLTTATASTGKTPNSNVTKK